MSLKIGTILCSSWGYDQTNVDFYEVVKATKAMVHILPIDSEIVESKTGQDFVVPVVRTKDYDKDDLYHRRVGKNFSGEPSVIDKYGYRASLWNGKPRYQTAAGYGH